MKTRSLLLAAVMAASTFALTACQTTPKTEEARANLADDVQTKIRRFQRDDPSLKDFLDHSAGYVVFPSIGKAAFIAGGAFGRGQLFENGQATGYAKLTQASVGLSVGAQDYAEIVVFGTADALRSFKEQQLSFGANASAVIIKAGAASTASFNNGVAVFAQTNAGAMLELSLSGQQLTYTPTEAGTEPPQ